MLGCRCPGCQRCLPMYQFDETALSYLCDDCAPYFLQAEGALVGAGMQHPERELSLRNP